jgi:hypothetical protein
MANWISSKLKVAETFFEQASQIPLFSSLFSFFTSQTDHHHHHHYYLGFIFNVIVLLLLQFVF